MSFMKGLAFAATLFFFSVSVHAERFAVVLKDSKRIESIQSLQFLSASPKLHINSSLDVEFNEGSSSVDKVLPGLNALILESDLDLETQLQENPEVAFVEKEVFYPAPLPIPNFKPTTEWDLALLLENSELAPAPGLPEGLKTIRVPEVWKKSHHGEGAEVMVLDTGIDEKHPVFLGKVLGTRNLMTDDNNENGVDVDGHGTHVAGTILASKTLSGFAGVAPGAQIYSGKVCSAMGCSNIAVAEGLNWASELKVDVVNLSLGGHFGSQLEKLAIERAEKAGVVVVAASGNFGTDSVSYPAAFPEAIAVGAVDGDLKRGRFSQFGPELDVVAPGVEVVSSVPVGTGRVSHVIFELEGKKRFNIPSRAFGDSSDALNTKKGEVVYASLGRSEDYSQLNVENKIVLVRRGDISFAEKLTQALARGAQALLVVNNEPGLISGSIGDGEEKTLIPVLMLEKALGETAIKALNQGKKVRSEIRTLISNYAAHTGTSMAAPHVAGVVALMKAANPSLTPQQVREILAETSTPLGPNVKNEYGRGLINAELAVKKALEL